MWQEQALCAEVDPELFFPLPDQGSVAAKRICVGCEVKGECLEDAVEVESRGTYDDIHGVRGGMSASQRILARGARSRIAA